MKASEAREIADKNSRHRDLHPVFKEIKKAAKSGQISTFLMERHLDQEKSNILQDEYGYEIEFIDGGVYRISW